MRGRITGPSAGLCQNSSVGRPIHQQRIRRCSYCPAVNSSADRAFVCTIADFRINFARVGTQTHMDSSELLLYRDWEPDWAPIATRTNRATVNRAKRFMG